VTDSGRILRWVKFNAVGAMGIVIQLGVLAILTSGLGVNYMIATAAAVESAVLHNFVWHERFTWRERESRARWERLLKFNFSNGAISLIGNVLLMKAFAGILGLNYFVANVLSIATCSLANFLVSDVFVFRPAAAGKLPALAGPEWNGKTPPQQSPR
jgi:putative flippase GtrA